MYNLIVGAIVFLSFAANASEVSRPLSIETICQTSVSIEKSIGKVTVEDQQNIYNLCVLKNAAKRAFSLADKPAQSSELQKMSQEAEALCNVKIALEMAIDPSLNKIRLIKECYLETITTKLEK